METIGWPYGKNQRNQHAVSLAHCRPPKSSLLTLLPSGCVLGLAPSDSLSQTGQTDSDRLVKQLLDKGAIQRNLWGLTLLNGHEGLLSLGGTAAEKVDEIEDETNAALEKLAELERTQAKNRVAEEKTEEEAPKLKRSLGSNLGSNAAAANGIVARRKVEHGKHKMVKSRTGNWEDTFKWSKVQGAQGWWQTLMSGVYVDNSKVLKNQPVIMDVSTF
jgi:hypothetical protein